MRATGPPNKTGLGWVTIKGTVTGEEFMSEKWLIDVLKDIASLAEERGLHEFSGSLREATNVLRREIGSPKGGLLEPANIRRLPRRTDGISGVVIEFDPRRRVS